MVPAAMGPAAVLTQDQLPENGWSQGLAVNLTDNHRLNPQ